MAFRVYRRSSSAGGVNMETMDLPMQQRNLFTGQAVCAQCSEDYDPDYRPAGSPFCCKPCSNDWEFYQKQVEGLEELGGVPRETRSLI